MVRVAEVMAAVELLVVVILAVVVDEIISKSVSSGSLGNAVVVVVLGEITIVI